MMLSCSSVFTSSNFNAWAQDLVVERKMLKKELVDSLVGHLRSASNIQLLVVIVNFLRKLSVFEENKV
jgi:predicted small metal-binding protein